MRLGAASDNREEALFAVEEPSRSTARRKTMSPVFRFAAVAVLALTLGGCNAQSGTDALRNGRIPAPKPSGPVSPVPGEIRPTCQPTQLHLALAWHRDATGSLSGDLRATNPGTRACGLLLKPSVQPLGVDGKPLKTLFLTTMEGRYGPNALRPGHTAISGISWAGWCGKPAGPNVEVSWRDVETTVTVSGARQPACPTAKTAPTNMSSTWFEGLLSGA